MTSKSTSLQYQRLKNNLLPLLYEDTGSLFYYMAQKRLHRKDNAKRSILSILKLIGGKSSFFEIVRHLVLCGDVDTLTELILGARASSSQKALSEGTDCCLVCEKEGKACRGRLSPLEHPDRIRYLLYLRLVEAGNALKFLKRGYDAQCFTVLLKNPLLMKFLANYELVTDIKNELKKEGSLAGGKTLYKGSGKYCPFDDVWRLS